MANWHTEDFPTLNSPVTDDMETSILGVVDDASPPQRPPIADNIYAEEDNYFIFFIRFWLLFSIITIISLTVIYPFWWSYRAEASFNAIRNEMREPSTLTTKALDSQHHRVYEAITSMRKQTIFAAHFVDNATLAHLDAQFDSLLSAHFQARVAQAFETEGFAAARHWLAEGKSLYLSNLTAFSCAPQNAQCALSHIDNLSALSAHFGVKPDVDYWLILAWLNASIEQDDAAKQCLERAKSLGFDMPKF